MLRDIDLISTCIEDKDLMAKKCQQLAGQVNDDTLRNLRQNISNIQQQHIMELRRIQSQVQSQTGR